MAISIHIETPHQAHDPAGRAPPVPAARCGDVVRIIARAEGERPEARGWSAEVFWLAEGSGDRDKAVIDTVAGQAGTRMEFWFTVPAEGPVTFHGKHVHIRWRVRVRLDVPWAIDPKAEQEFVVMPAETGPALKKEALSMGPTVAQEAPSGIGREIAWLVLLTLFLWSVAIGVFLNEGHPGSLCGFAGGCITLAVLVSLLWKPLAKMKVRIEKTELSSGTLGLGDTLEGTVTILSKTDVQLNAVRIELVCEERARERVGTRTRYYTENVHKAEVVGARNLRLRPRHRQSVPFRFEIPAMSMHSFAADNNWVTWRLRVRCDIPNWPDLMEEYVLTVKPVFVKG